MYSRRKNEGVIGTGELMAVFTYAVGVVCQLAVIERQFLSLTNYTHHSSIQRLNGRQRAILVLRVKLKTQSFLKTCTRHDDQTAGIQLTFDP